MSGLELAFINLAEQATIDTAQNRDAQGFDENYDAAEVGGRAAGAARRAFEEETGCRVVNPKSYLEERKKLRAGDDDGEGGNEPAF